MIRSRAFDDGPLGEEIESPSELSRDRHTFELKAQVDASIARRQLNFARPVPLKRDKLAPIVLLLSSYVDPIS